MKQSTCRVTENRTLWDNVQLLTLDAPEFARAMRPGQFALARETTARDPYLRRTLWLYHVANNLVAFILPASDPLASRVRVGDTLDVLAPLGNALEFGANVRHVLLIAEGMRVASLVVVAHDAVAQGRAVVLATRTFANETTLPAHLLSSEIEYRADGNLLAGELITWADRIIASGSDELYRALADAIRSVRYQLEPGFAHGLVELPMPCGSGQCGACAVETTRGAQMACVDGPWFDLIDLENRRTR